jgi:LCP family protein required for cell wall assembly
MRIPGWTFIVGIFALLAGTVACSLVAFASMRQFAIELPGAPNSPFAVVGYILGGGEDEEATPFDESAPPQPSVVVPTAVVSAPAVETAIGAPTTEATSIVDTNVTPTATIDPLLDDPIVTDPRRKTILLMGIDQRDAINEPGPFRTDTMMVITVDPARKTAGVLSIPRDLWVTIPGFGQDRINTANATGDANAFPGGGPALAAETVATNLGIRVDYYVLVNFHVFTAVVDLLAPNGVEICVSEMIDDPDYPDAGYGYIHVHFDPGCQQLDAEHLLQYARTRATYGGDFDRARRQQEVLDTMRAKVLSVGGVANFVAQAPAIWDELKDSYKTNLTLEQIIGLGRIMAEIPRENIEFGVIDNRYVDLGTTPTGDQILIPNQTAISDLIQRIFNPQADLTLADLRTRAEAENAKIVIYNNTDVTGLATQTREFLASQQVDVVQVGNVPTPTNGATVIRDYTGSPWTARYLAALLGLSVDQIEPGNDGLTAYDVMVVVGTDIEPLLSGGGN